MSVKSLPFRDIDRLLSVGSLSSSLNAKFCARIEKPFEHRIGEIPSHWDRMGKFPLLTLSSIGLSLSISSAKLTKIFSCWSGRHSGSSIRLIPLPATFRHRNVSMFPSLRISWKLEILLLLKSSDLWKKNFFFLKCTAVNGDRVLMTHCKFLKTVLKSGSTSCTISFPCNDKWSINGHSCATYRTSVQHFILQFCRWRLFRNTKIGCSSAISSFVGCLIRFLLQIELFVLANLIRITIFHLRQIQNTQRWNLFDNVANRLPIPDQRSTQHQFTQIFQLRQITGSIHIRIGQDDMS